MFLEDLANPIMSMVHQHHCMNYLRLLYLCHMDMTLKPVMGTDAEDNDSNLIYHLGTGLVQMCKDPQALVQEVSTNLN